ncbi:hypothetical protein G7L40_00940 [Paenibacillus polymyxa]|uniref:Uncharacterized protein n=1 Tax=Paenibacillus polymyxa TaxID=1406 RepID=A0A378XW70_PAEPO|nr:hypothetical protein [Paenibacillus polymyxa]MBE7897276.1 hypothetical protein [Paenibacillus polymyxa]MBG9763120.1 hypothetical protein [Paenibacillus polymyxa]MBG9766426.1 hypothetical protein [Paenibacillus polymyxa]MCC3257475.1 hypothetical protein [Paenibacillus polymyxa]QPK51249.1 hypothetical protein G7035_00935 [Paenibacillus polymyxa]
MTQLEFNFYSAEIVQETPDLRKGMDGQLLNGCFYERSTGSFVSYVLGRRHYVFNIDNLQKDWMEKTKRDRWIE